MIRVHLVPTITHHQTSSWKLHLSRNPGLPCRMSIWCNDPTRKSTPLTCLSHQWLQWFQWLLGSQTSEVTFSYSVLTHLFPYTNSTSTSSNLSQAPSILHLGWQAQPIKHHPTLQFSRRQRDAFKIQVWSCHSSAENRNHHQISWRQSPPLDSDAADILCCRAFPLAACFAYVFLCTWLGLVVCILICLSSPGWPELRILPFSHCNSRKFSVTQLQVFCQVSHCAASFPRHYFSIYNL